MPPIRDHDVNHEEFDEDNNDEGVRNVAEDDDMPGLVDQPPPPMTYTFFTEMTPLSFDPASASAPTSDPDLSVVPVPFTFPTTETQSTSLPPPPRTSHGKRRDASYIPRPPNAFILFRSSFIRSQQVTGKVEGNHSNLSKIIGMYWKTLPKEERDEWEAKAALAQLEHRKRYPDWRFRPGANALAKLKIKDGGGGGVAGPSRQRRIRGAKDPPDEGGGEETQGQTAATEVEETESEDVMGKGKGRATRPRSVRGRTKAREEDGKAKAKVKAKEDTRFAKIADLLVEGKKGVELEIAVKEWEGGRKGKKRAKRDSSTSKDARPSMQLPTRVDTTSSSDTATASPALSIAPATYSPLSIWSVTTSTSTPATPDTDELPPARRLLPHQRSYPRRSRSRSTSRSRSRSPVDFPQQQQFHQEGSTTEGQGPTPPSFKRSLSAPASHHRLAYPKRLQVASTSLPLPLPLPHASRSAPTSAGSEETAYAHTQGRRVRHRASASVSFSVDQLRASAAPITNTTTMAGDAGPALGQGQGHGRGHRSPLAQHQHPLVESPTRLLGHEPPGAQAQVLGRRDTVSFPISSPFARRTPQPQPHVQPRMHIHTQLQPHQHQHQHQHLGSAYYQPSPQQPQPHPHRLTWQQEEDRRRMEVDRGYAYWWRPQPDNPANENEAEVRGGVGVGVGMYEPVREGSFEFDSGTTGTGTAVGGERGYSTSSTHGGDGMDRRYLEQFPPLPQGRNEAASDGVQWVQASGTGRVGLVRPTDEPETTTTTTTTMFGNPTSSPTSPISPQQYTPLQIQTQTHALTTHTTSSAGGYFYPVPATPISPLTPYSSTFSSLAGWDGEAKMGSSSSFSSGQEGMGASGGGGHSGGGVGRREGGPWYSGGGAWRGVQGVGLQGGRGEWTNEWVVMELDGVLSATTDGAANTPHQFP